MTKARFALARELCKAIQRDDLSLTELLLSQGANPNTPLPDGVSPFHIAVGAENIGYVKLMLQFDGNPNVRSSEGLTPLHVAAMWGKYEELLLLICNGGDPFIYEEDGKNVYDLAEEYGDARCIELLKDYREWDTDMQEDAAPKYSLLPVSSCSSQDSLLKCQTWDLSAPPNTVSSTGSSPAVGYSCSPTSDRPQSSLSHDSSTDLRCPSSHSAQTSPADSRTYPSDLSSCSGIDEEIAFNFARSVSLLSCSFTNGDKRVSSGTAGSDLEGNELDLGMCNSQQSDDNLSDVSTATYVISRGSPRSGLPRVSDIGSDWPVLGQDSPKSNGGIQCLKTDSDHRYSVTAGDMYELIHGDVDDFVRWGYETNKEEYTEDEKGQNYTENEKNLEEDMSHNHLTNSAESSNNDNGQIDEELKNDTDISEPILPGSPDQEETLNSSISTVASTLYDDHSQGLDVTSPDHPLLYVKSSTSSSEDDDSRFDRTVLFCGSILEEDEEAFEDDSDDDEVVMGEEEEKGENGTVPFSSPESACVDSTTEEFYSAEEHLSRDERSSPHGGVLTDESASCGSRHCPDTLILGDDCEQQSCAIQHTQQTCPDTVILNESQAQSERDNMQQCPDTVILDDTQSRSVKATQTCPDTLILDGSQSPGHHNESSSLRISPSRGQSCPDTVILDESAEEQFEDLRRHQIKSRDSNSLPDTLILNSSQESPGLCNKSSQRNRLRSSRKTRNRFAGVRDASDLLSSDDTSNESSFDDRRDRYSIRSAGGTQTDCSSEKPSSLESVDQTIEYIYTDADVGAALIERRCPSSCNSSQAGTQSVNSSLESSSDETIIYDWQQYQTDTDSDSPAMELPPEVSSLSDKDVRAELNSLGESPGPVTSTTRGLYLELLAKLKKEPKKANVTGDSNNPTSGFVLELHQCLCQKQLIPDMQEDEGKITAQFDQPDPQRKWREGTLKSSFNYLLLDPRVTRNLPVRYHHGLSEMDAFSMFVSAIFYVGKGKRARPYAHFYEALEQISNPRLRPSKKVQHILDVWQLGLGVVSLHCFQSVIPVEAYTREACMVEALGLSRLTNAKKGDYYGIAATWPASKKRKMGIHLLSKAFKIFLIEGERQIRPADVRVGQ